MKNENRRSYHRIQSISQWTSLSYPKAKELTDADHLIVVMSGTLYSAELLQFFKDVRTQMALQCGASLVWNFLSAMPQEVQNFSPLAPYLFLTSLAVSILFALEVNAARSEASFPRRISAGEPAAFKESLQKFLRPGLLSRHEKKAAAQMLSDQELCSILDEPNNILGIEYLQSTVGRKAHSPTYNSKTGAHYHDTVPAKPQFRLRDHQSCFSPKKGRSTFSACRTCPGGGPLLCKRGISYPFSGILQ